VEEEHTEFTPEQADDAVVRHIKDGGKLFWRVVPLVPIGRQWFIRCGGHDAKIVF
jgi:hypothetical protein